MAWKEKGRSVVKSLGAMVGLLITFYVFDQVLQAISPFTSNASSTLYTAASFVKTLVPIVGIIAGFEQVYKALRSSGMM